LNRRAETRYRIARQLRQTDDSERHPAWTAAFGFPEAPDDVSSPEEAASYIPDGGVRLFLVRTDGGKLFAGHTSGSNRPADWPAGFELEKLFGSGQAGGLLVYTHGASPGLFLEPSKLDAPFVAETGWSKKEMAVVLDLYIEQGVDPEPAFVSATRARIKKEIGTERSNAEIAAKLQEIAAIDPTTESDVPPDDDARDAWKVFAPDADALRVALERPKGLPPVDLEAPAAHVKVETTTVESAPAEQYRVRGTVGTIAERREQRLVERYKAHLEALKHKVTAHTYLLPGYPVPLRCDLFDESDPTLVEAKGLVSREMVRMAIGQLLDYRRFEPGSPKLQILLPWRPSRDLVALIHSIGASAVWAGSEGFEFR
jgi:hypothetical protein